MSENATPAEPRRFGYPFPDWIGPALRRAQHASYSDFTASVTKGEVRPAQLIILILVRDHENLTQSRIGRMMNAKTANVAVMIHELEAAGLIRRAPRREGAGRAQPLALTALGAERLAEWEARAARHEDRLIAAIGEAEVGALLAALERISQAFGMPTLPLDVSPRK